MSDEGTQRIGWRVFELANDNSQRNCSDDDCDERAWFYVHAHGFSCERHLPKGASPPA